VEYSKHRVLYVVYNDRAFQFRIWQMKAQPWVSEGFSARGLNSGCFQGMAKRIFSRGGEISFYHIESKRENYFSINKCNKKISDFKIQPVKGSLPTPMGLSR